MERYWEEVPQEVKELPKHRRLEWYEKRAARYLPAWEFIDSLDHGLSLEELYDKLKETVTERKRLENILFVMESGEFRRLHEQLELVVKEIRRLNNLRVTYLLNKELSDMSSCMCKSAEAIKIALELEEHIKCLCKASEIDPAPYLLVHTLRIRGFMNGLT